MAQLEAEAIGRRIAQARKEMNGLTQERMAELASFSKRSLQDYEAGVTIPYKHLREIGAITQRPVEWFLHGDEPEATGLTERVDQLQKTLDEVVERLREQDVLPPRAAP